MITDEGYYYDEAVQDAIVEIGGWDLAPREIGMYYAASWRERNEGALTAGRRPSGRGKSENRCAPSQ